MVYDSLKFGLELEGGYRKEVKFKEINKKLRTDYEDYKGNLKSIFDNSAKLKHLKKADFYTDTLGERSYKVREDEDGIKYKEEKEIVSSNPITQERIYEHIKDIKFLFEEIGFKYHPLKCGLHIHFSPLEGDWDMEHLKVFLPRLYCTMTSLIRFFKNRHQTSYAFAGDLYKKMRVLTEDLKRCDTFNEFKKKYSEAGLRRGTILNVNTGYNSIEIRCLPPEPELLNSFINIIVYLWENTDEDILNRTLIKGSIYDILEITNQSEEIGKYKRYFKKWIKEE